MQPVSARRLGTLLWIEGENPPVNALSVAVRQGLLNAVLNAANDRNAEAIALGAKGKTFFCGADIEELDRGIQSPGLIELVHACDRSVQPVIAALHGSVLGGGIVVAYACDWRVAAIGTQMALPEVRLGLLPTFGGTQWLSRWLGVEAALELVIDGKVWDVDQALGAGLIDEVVDAENMEAAINKMAGHHLKKRRIGDPGLWIKEPEPAVSMAFDRRRTHLSTHAPDFEAAWTCLDVMQRGLSLPIEQALSLEAEAFEQLRKSEQSRRLRRLFFAERRLRRCNSEAIARVSCEIRLVDTEDKSALEGLARRAVMEGAVPDLEVFDALMVREMDLPRHRRSLIANLIDEHR